MKPALLVIDVQKEFFKIGPATARSLDRAIATINAAIASFRIAGLPVVCIRNVDEHENIVPGVEGFDVPESLDVLPSDLHIDKRYDNAFNKTSLERDLNERGVDTVIVTGYCAEYCVLSTYRGARDLDLTALVLLRGTASESPEHIAFVEGISEVISVGALTRVLR